MKCKKAIELLPGLAGGDLGLRPDEAARCQEHVASCQACAARLTALKRTIFLLRQVGQTEPLPTGFQQALRRRLANAPPPSPSVATRFFRILEALRLDSAPRLGLALGAAALALGLAILPVQKGRLAASGNGGSNGHSGAAGSEQEVAAAFRVPQQRIAVVQFDFVADVEVVDVEFEVNLPSELHFIDDGKVLTERRLVWRGALNSGSNPIPLAVLSTKPGRYRVTAQARGAGLAVRHDILLEVVHS